LALSVKQQTSIAPLYSNFAQELSNTDSPDKIQSINMNLLKKLKDKLPGFDEMDFLLITTLQL
jgi:hypothetical protein